MAIMRKPTAEQILERIRQMEHVRDEAETAGDVEHIRRAVKLLGILWKGFAERRGQPGRWPEEFEKMYEMVH
jgi:hypothetical protein